MRIFRWKRAATYGTFNFDLLQLYVCELENDGRSARGITVLPVGGAELPFRLSNHDLDELAITMRRAVQDETPCRWRHGSNALTQFFGLQFHFLATDGARVRAKLNPGLLGNGQKISVAAKTLTSCAASLDALQAGSPRTGRARREP